MDNSEARRVALNEVRVLREMAWADLRDRYLDSPKTVEVEGPSGTRYQVKTHAVWDGKRVAISAFSWRWTTAGWRAFLPLSESFIVSPDGSFVGE
jgi:hypothetical protein